MLGSTDILGVIISGAMLVTLAHSAPGSDSGSVQPSAQPAMDRVRAGSFARDQENTSNFVLLSLNIERGQRQPEILQAFRAALRADLYLLQEVDLHARRTGYGNVAEELARELGMNYVFGIEFEELAQGRPGLPAYHGQAVLSRFEISRSRVLRFRHQPHNWFPWWKPRLAGFQPRAGGRMALIVELELGGETLVIYNTHLESRANDRDRAEQMREILADVQTHYTPDTRVIVAGDLNTRKGVSSRVVQELKAAGFHDVLQSSREPLRTKVGSNRRLDWIFVRHLNASDGRISNAVLSDHYPVAVCIVIPLPSPVRGNPVSHAGR